MKVRKGRLFGVKAAVAGPANGFFGDGFNVWMSLLSGILLAAVHQPIPLFPLAFFALVPLIASIKPNNLKASFAGGLVTGVVSWLGTVYWIVVAMNHYGGMNPFLSSLVLLLLALYLALYLGIFTLVVAYLAGPFHLPVYFSAPFVWVLLEYLRGFLLTGFPWAYLAYSQHDFLPFIQVVSVAGVYGISFLLVAVNGILCGLWQRRPISVLYISVIALLCGATLFHGFSALKTTEEPPDKKTAIVQGNIRQDVKWDETFQIRTINTYTDMTLRSGRGVDLIIWPETAMPFIFDRELFVKKHIGAIPGILGTNLLFGTLARDEKDRFYNAAHVLDRKGRTAGVYRKNHLVPFGEYTPLVSYLPFLAGLTAQGADFSPGEEGYRPVGTDLGNIGILICYEGVFPSITRETVRNGAQVLVNLTNDAWYDRTAAPFQHFAFYVFRAIETDRWVLRSANTGISGIIDPHGRVRSATPIFTGEVLKGDFAMRSTKTFYVRYGDWFVGLAALALVCAVFAGWRRGRRKD